MLLEDGFACHTRSGGVDGWPDTGLSVACQPDGDGVLLALQLPADFITASDLPVLTDGDAISLRLEWTVYDPTQARVAIKACCSTAPDPTEAEKEEMAHEARLDLSVALCLLLPCTADAAKARDASGVTASGGRLRGDIVGVSGESGETALALRVDCPVPPEFTPEQLAVLTTEWIVPDETAVGEAMRATGETGATER